jgi:predicted small metal-binding protein
MTWTIACGDVMPGCTSVLTGETREAVMAAVAEHAAADHGVTDIDEPTMTAVSGAVHQR